MLAAVSDCLFCTNTSATSAVTFDLGALPNMTWQLTGGKFSATSPCLAAVTPQCHPSGMPATQSCRGLGRIGEDTVVTPTGDGFDITIMDGSNDPPCGHAPANPDGHRRLVYRMVCNKTAPVTNPPEDDVVEHPSCTYVVTWQHPSACGGEAGPATSCPHSAPPAPPTPPPTPPTPAPTCSPDSKTCLPSWNPTYDMFRSTVLYTCNNTGLHDVAHAIKFGTVVYDWSNGKALWANAHPVSQSACRATAQAHTYLAHTDGARTPSPPPLPVSYSYWKMTSQELITKQAEMVLAADPGIPGQAPRVWAYRNTIKALNW